MQSGILGNSALGEKTFYVGNYPGANYLSESFHHVKIGPLTPGQMYFYRCVLLVTLSTQYLHKS